MSRNPYLAASRPSSSYTRSSRTSTRNDYSSPSLGYGLGRSRSSAALSGRTNRVYCAGYIPASQRSSSTSRYSQATGTSASTLSNRASDYKPSHRAAADDEPPKKESDETSKQPVPKSSSSHNLRLATAYDDEAGDEIADDYHKESEKTSDSDHLKNYQQSKLNQPQPTIRARSSLQSLDSKESEDTKLSTTSLDSSETEKSYADSEKLPSGSVPRHLKTQGSLLKSKSLDIGQQTPDESPMLAGSMSVDRLLLRSESMTERELRKSYKELVMENEKLRRKLDDTDEIEKEKQQEWIRKERQMQRKISELEEENRQLEQWKHESQRLKDENRSLIRVVTKLSSKQN